MSDFKSFMKKNRKENLSKEHEIFIGDFEEPFKVRTVSYKEFSEIQNKNTMQEIETVKVLDPETKRRKKQRQVINKRNETAIYFDLCLAAIVSPDLQDSELQDYYEAMSPEELLNNMLTIKEIAELADQIVDLSNLDQDDINDKIEEAKN